MNKQLVNNILCIIGVIAVILVGIYLFATQHVLPEGMTQIRWSVDNNPMRKVVISSFEAKNPDIHVINDPNADLQTVLTQLAGDVPPDIITPYTIEAFRRLQRLGQLEDLTPYVEKYKIPVDKLRPELHDFVYIKDPEDGNKEKVYGIPENAGPFCLFYNKDLFDQAGVPYPTNDMTWEDIREIAKKLTTYQDINGRQVVKTKGIYITEDPEFFIRMYGGRLFSEDGKKCLINTPEARKGLEFLETMKMKDHSVPSASEAQSMAPTGGWGGANLLLVQGRVAMLLCGRYLIIQYRDYYPKGVRLGIARCPKSPCDNNLIYSKCYCIPKNSKHKEEAARFLAMILSDENQANINDYGDGWSAIDTPLMREVAKFNPKYPMEDNNEELLKDFGGARTLEVSPWINTVDFMTVWQREVDKVWIGQQTMADACAHTERDVNKIIERNIKNPNFLN